MLILASVILLTVEVVLIFEAASQSCSRCAVSSGSSGVVWNFWETLAKVAASSGGVRSSWSVRKAMLQPPARDFVAALAHLVSQSASLRGLWGGTFVCASRSS